MARQPITNIPFDGKVYSLPTDVLEGIRCLVDDRLWEMVKAHAKGSEAYDVMKTVREFLGLKTD